LFLSACALTPNPDIASFARNSGANSFEVLGRRIEDPAQTLVLEVAHDRQTRGPSCGAHALASVINYWRGPGTVTGDAMFARTPPESPSGYSMAELMRLAAQNGVVASAVRLDHAGIVAELERGRPVIVPVTLPSIYIQQRSLPGGETPVLGLARNTLIYRAGRVQELTRVAMVDHYLIVVGYDSDSVVVVDPVMGYRTISAGKLERYRRPFANAAMVFSKAPAARTPPGRARR
jgi:predicted double-glycine peptidase